MKIMTKMAKRLRPMIFMKALPYLKTEALRKIKEAKLSKVVELETQRIIHRRFKRQQIVKFQKENEEEMQRVKKYYKRKYQKQISDLKRQNNMWIQEDLELQKLIKRSKLIRSALITESFHYNTADRTMEQFSIMTDSEYSGYSEQSESDLPPYSSDTDHEKESNHSDSNVEI